MSFPTRLEVSEAYPNVFNTSPWSIGISVSAMRRLLGEEGFDQPRFDNIPVHFMPELVRRDGKTIYGTFNTRPLDADNLRIRWRSVRVYMGSVELATSLHTDLPTGKNDPLISLGRNTSGVLVHELLHLKHDDEAIARAMRLRSKYIGFGLFRVISLIDPHLKKTRKYLQGEVVDEASVLERVSDLFGEDSYLEHLVRVSR